MSDRAAKTNTFALKIRHLVRVHGEKNALN